MIPWLNSTIQNWCKSGWVEATAVPAGVSAPEIRVYILDLRWRFDKPPSQPVEPLPPPPSSEPPAVRGPRAHDLPPLHADVKEMKFAFYSTTDLKKSTATAVDDGDGSETIKKLVARLEKHTASSGSSSSSSKSASGSGNAPGPVSASGSERPAADADDDDYRNRLWRLANDDDVLSAISDEDQILQELAEALSELGPAGPEDIHLDWEGDVKANETDVRKAEDRILKAKAPRAGWY